MHEHSHIPLCECSDVTVLCTHGVKTEFTANGSVTITKNKKKEKSCIPIDVAIPADRNYARKEAERKIVQEYTYRDKTNVGHEVYDCTSNYWRQWNSKKI